MISSPKPIDDVPMVPAKWAERALLEEQRERELKFGNKLLEIARLIDALARNHYDEAQGIAEKLKEMTP